MFLQRYLKNCLFNRCFDDAEEKSCVHYPICYLIIMKYIYVNLIFASDFIFLSDSVGFTSSVHPEKRHARSERFDMIF